MPRHTRPKKKLIVRFKDHSGMPKSSIVFSSNRGSPGSNFGKGKVKVLRVGKISEEQVKKVGEYNDMPRRLMAEFEADKRRAPYKQNSIGNQLIDQV